jgi:zinc/manganese transport system permease protein
VATLIGLASSVTGLILSFHLGLPSGPAIILAAGLAYLVSLAFGRHGGLVKNFLPQRHLEA